MQNITISKKSVNIASGNSSPVARKIAQQNNISLTNIKGTGPKGRVVKSDVMNF